MDKTNEPIISKASRGKPSLEDSYRMIRILGRGTMASVYLAQQLSMARPVALKILSPALAADKDFVERFLREAKASARLNHPNIVTAIDFGEVDNRYFLAMEYIDGETLAALIAREAPLDEKRVIAIGHQVILALEHAAQHNVIHRDVKPANIMICRDGRVKLADFGLAILLDHPGVAESSRKAVGTPYYMAPEQLEGGLIDWRADQCSLGASLYEAVTGMKPFNGNSVSDILTRRLFENPLPAWRARRGVSRSFSTILAKMMARSADDRYQSFSDLKKDFDRLESGKRLLVAKPTSVRSMAREVHFPRDRRGHTVVIAKAKAVSAGRRWNAILLASTAFLLMLGGYAILHWDELAGPRPAAAGTRKIDAQADNVSFQKYQTMRTAWSEALRLLIRAEGNPSANNFARAQNALEHVAERDEYAGSVYQTMAINSLRNLARDIKQWEAEQERTAERNTPDG